MSELKGVYISIQDLKNIQIMIDYLLSSERKHYEEEFGDIVENIHNPDFILSKDFYKNSEINHIYAITRRLKDSIDFQTGSFK